MNKNTYGVITSAIAGVILSTSAATAEVVEYRCLLNTDNAQGWIAGNVSITIQSDSEAVVLDGITQHYLGGAAQASVSNRRNGDRRILWAVNARDIAGQSARMRYTATLKPDNRVQIRAVPAGYRANLSARGTCSQK